MWPSRGNTVWSVRGTETTLGWWGWMWLREQSRGWSRSVEFWVLRCSGQGWATDGVLTHAARCSSLCERTVASVTAALGVEVCLLDQLRLVGRAGDCSGLLRQARVVVVDRWVPLGELSGLRLHSLIHSLPSVWSDKRALESRAKDTLTAYQSPLRCVEAGQSGSQKLP